MAAHKIKKLVGDFETTVYENQAETEVWASAIAEIGDNTDDVTILHSIRETYDYLLSLNQDVIIYYHNLKFDGSFWISFLLREKDYTTALNEEQTNFKAPKDLLHKELIYSISNRGMWYRIIFRYGMHTVEIRDSLKLLPFSIDSMATSFNTKHKKLEMEYKGIRYAGCDITEEEKHYIANDVLILKESLEMMFSDGHNRLTIGSCCLSEYKNIVKVNSYANDDWEKYSFIDMLGYEKLFPDLTKEAIPFEKFGAENADAFIRKSYRGGWCYVKKDRQKQVIRNGITIDVNSLYPSVMHSMSGNIYPIGQPTFWSGDRIPFEAQLPDRYYFLRLRVKFMLKPKHLPFIQIKGNGLYNPTEMLESSFIYDKTQDAYFDRYLGCDGVYHDSTVELTMTCTDWKLFKEHYQILFCEILGGCWFRAKAGLFDEYIDKYAEIKKNNKGAKRTEAKLFLNNLYGKMASSDDSGFKVAYVREDESLGFLSYAAHDKKVGYIPVGSAITSYAREFTIRAAQKNYDHFIYADTDSIHGDMKESQLKGMKLHDVDFCCWKVESHWTKGFFTRQKTYVELIDGKKYNIKCAGMPQKCKDLLELSFRGAQDINGEWTQEEKNFLFDEGGNKVVRTFEDFNIGLTVPGKLTPVQIKGGVVLADTPYEMR